MNYPIKLQGFEGQTIEVQSSFIAGPKLLVNGRPAPNGKKRGQMLLQRDDGLQVVATWKPQVLGLDIPQLTVDGQAVQVVEPLKWYQLLWSALPILLVFGGGAIGGAIGAVAAVINTRIFRSDSDAWFQYAVTAGISILAVLLYLFVGTLVLRALGG
jgi:hypothetical protein